MEDNMFLWLISDLLNTRTSIENLNDEDKTHLREFETPPPAREVSLIYHKSQLKMQLIEALKSNIDGIIRGAIAFSDVDIISPIRKE